MLPGRVDNTIKNRWNTQILPAVRKLHPENLDIYGLEIVCKSSLSNRRGWHSPYYRSHEKFEDTKSKDSKESTSRSDKSIRVWIRISEKKERKWRDFTFELSISPAHKDPPFVRHSTTIWWLQWSSQHSRHLIILDLFDFPDSIQNMAPGSMTLCKLKMWSMSDV